MSTMSAESATLPVVEEEFETRTRRQPRYHVVLLDDNDHTYDYVIRMVEKIFGYNTEKAYEIACEVDASGRVILMTTTLEHAELKQEQVHGFGQDPLIPHCKGSMSAIVEPAPE
jgi:ATP-dependent Clp protease adaptor protein ClpS